MKNFKQIIREDLKSKNLEYIFKNILSISSKAYGNELHIITKRMDRADYILLTNILKTYKEGATSATYRKAKFITIRMEY